MMINLILTRTLRYHQRSMPSAVAALVKGVALAKAGVSHPRPDGTPRSRPVLLEVVLRMMTQMMIRTMTVKEGTIRDVMEAMEDDPGHQQDNEVGSLQTPTEDSSIRSEELLARSWKGTDRPRSSLGSVRMEDFSGDRGKYRNWRRAVLAQQQHYRLESAELAMMIYLSCKGDAREVLDQITIEEMVAAGGLAKLWQLLNEAYGESSDEYFERIEAEFNQYRRQPGQSIASYLGQIKKLKAQYLREDEGTILSDRAWAQRLLVRASLSRGERLDVFYSAGGAYNAKMIESALRHRASRVHEDERRTPALGSAFRKFPFARSSSSRSTSASTRASTAPSVASSFRSKGAGKGHHRMMALKMRTWKTWRATKRPMRSICKAWKKSLKTWRTSRRRRCPVRLRR